MQELNVETAENLGVFKQGKGDAISDAGFPSEKKRNARC